MTSQTAKQMMDSVHPSVDGSLELANMSPHSHTRVSFIIFPVSCECEQENDL